MGREMAVRKYDELQGKKVRCKNIVKKDNV